MEEFGPVQILVVGFDDLQYNGKILEEFARLNEKDIVRLLDLVVVEKDQSGEVTSIGMTDLPPEQAEKLGAMVGALMGLEAEGDKDVERSGATEAAEEGVFNEETRWAIADAIPFGEAAAVALIEHRWAIPLRDAIRGAGGVPLADTWIHPEDLVAAGAKAGEFKKSA
jgi:hypothetical protein